MTFRFDSGVTSGLSVGGDASMTSAMCHCKDSRQGEEGQVLMGDKGSVEQALKSKVRCQG